MRPVLFTSGQGPFVSFFPRVLWAALYFIIIVSLCILLYAFESTLRRGMPEKLMAPGSKI